MHVEQVLVDGSRHFTCVYTLMNGVGEVLGYWFLHDKSEHQVEGFLRRIYNRYVCAPSASTTINAEKLNNASSDGSTHVPGAVKIVSNLATKLL